MVYVSSFLIMPARTDDRQAKKFFKAQVWNEPRRGHFPTQPQPRLQGTNLLLSLGHLSNNEFAPKGQSYAHIANGEP